MVLEWLGERYRQAKTTKVIAEYVDLPESRTQGALTSLTAEGFVQHFPSKLKGKAGTWAVTSRGLSEVNPECGKEGRLRMGLEAILTLPAPTASSERMRKIALLTLEQDR